MAAAPHIRSLELVWQSRRRSRRAHHVCVAALATRLWPWCLALASTHRMANCSWRSQACRRLSRLRRAEPSTWSSRATSMVARLGFATGQNESTPRLLGILVSNSGKSAVGPAEYRLTPSNRPSSTSCFPSAFNTS